MVLFIHRPEYYKIYQDEAGRDLRGKAEIIIAKHRNGAVGNVLLTFRGEFARFQNPEDVDSTSEKADKKADKSSKSDSSLPPAPEGIISSRINNADTLPPASLDDLPLPPDIPFAPPTASDPVPY